MRLNLTRSLDSLTHSAVLAFAAWTLVYDVGLAAHLSTTLLLVIWALSLAAIAVALLRFRPAAISHAEPQSAQSAVSLSAIRRALKAAGIVLGLCAGLATVLHAAGLPWVWVPLLGLASAAAAFAWLLTGDTRWAYTPASGETPFAGSIFAACMASAAALFSLYIVRPTPDDVYYVSRSVWTAQHGQIAVRDILFTNQVIKPISGEPPISSIEVLDGALARMLGIPAAAFTYEISLPVLTFIAVWAVWLLIRRWAPDRYVLCFIVAVVYLAWTGAAASFGAFHLGTMWEGKAAFLSIMVPLLYFYMTAWAENLTWRSLLVIASGVAAAGLSSAAVYVVPLIAAAVVVPFLLNRMFNEALGAALSSAYPLAAGLVVALRSPLKPLPSEPFTAPMVWTWVMKVGVVGAIGGIALWTAPWLARRGIPALIATGISGLAGVLMIPGLIARLGDVFSIMAVIWRVLWVVPGPVLVGLLAAVPIPFPDRFRAVRRVFTLIPVGALCAALVISGIPVWSRQNGVTLSAHPSLKIGKEQLEQAREIVRTDHSPGNILSTGLLMETVPLLTTTRRVANPRSYYLTILPTVSTQFIYDRRLLTALADGKAPLPKEAKLRAALTRVDVGYACVPHSYTGAIRLLETAGFVRAASFGDLQCLRR
jgi:uncharacterized protein DUF6077